MRAIFRLFLLLVPLVGVPLTTNAQEAKVHRVGVIIHAGHSYAAVDGLREGLKELGLEEGKQYVLEIRDARDLS